MNDTADTAVRRASGRSAEEMRPVHIELDPLKFAEGSALIEVGDTRVLVAATIERRVPPFLIDKGSGWATAEYAMLPRATSTRSTREVKRGRPSGRSAEIQRLIGRSLRAVLDLSAFPDRTLTVDCDVLQADGGTRTASITGAYVAAASAFAQAFLSNDIPAWPFREPVAAISVGLLGDEPVLDLDAGEDAAAAVDLNVVGTHSGRLVEVQGTGEERTFSRQELDRMLDLAMVGIGRLAEIQQSVLEAALADVEAARERRRRGPAEPRDEKDLWGAP